MTKINASILSYQNRGKWGNAHYRGNVSGHVIWDLLDTFKPQKFVEVFSGGGTGKDVAQELGYANSIHLDLLNGWDALTDEIPETSDFVFSHPPYWDMVDYSKVRGSDDKDDLSNGMPYPEFIKKLDIVNRKIYGSLTNGGRHAFLVGDVRKNHQYYSIIKDMTWFGDLEDHLIKEQFNTLSGRKTYAGSFIPISHEHLLIFRKNNLWNLAIKFTKDFRRDLRSLTNVTWLELIRTAVLSNGGKAQLSDLYRTLEGCQKAKNNHNWQAKIRQVLQDQAYFKRTRIGVYEVI
ncbi:hypothetical protein C1940_17325 (plasmid) [Lactiplantibacillus plantarum subsp. plantarum]|uniref:hypothetical protein n=1 Tax=Lactiplantibacillus plantarum TaxID=1590 RepID=UPI000CD36BF1|nr:hypothetical protein [Lactiplantibacillus plantarum]AUV74213.1 hypothetical protein C1940_17325 [Lactiplantibacillus plantarum subsp. plantarum]